MSPSHVPEGDKGLWLYETTDSNGLNHLLGRATFEKA